MEEKPKPITERTLKDYRSIWLKCLEGKALGWHLVKQLTGKRMVCGDGRYHPTAWVGQIFRHYVRYLFAVGRLDSDTYSRLLLAVPGRKYGRRILVKAISEEEVLETGPLTLLVLSRGLPKGFVKHYSKLRELYVEYGAMVAIWYLLKHVFPSGAAFTQLKQAYQLVVGRSVSNGTVGNLLKRMLEKRVVAERLPGVYVVNVKDFDIVLSRVDVTRVRVQAATHSGKHVERSSREQMKGLSGEEVGVDLNNLPKPVERAWERAQEIAEEHSALAAFYFLLYTLMGAEATGYLLYWLSNWFVVCRSKTGFCYHFYSVLLHEMLRRLGLREGIVLNYFSKLQHQEALRIAQEYIREYYGSHPNARRLHYYLKEGGTCGTTVTSTPSRYTATRTVR